MKVPILFFLLVVFAIPYLYGPPNTSTVYGAQRRSSRLPKKAKGSGETRRVPLHVSAARNDLFMRTIEQLQTARPELTDEVLDCDKQIILAALPEIERRYERRGFSEEDVTDAVSTGWVEIRLHSPLGPNKCMVQRSFQEYAISLGKLIFRTTPDEANIKLNADDLGKKTRYSRWYEPNTYKVTYSKDGYVPTETQCEVKEGKATDCYVQLQQNP